VTFDQGKVTIAVSATASMPLSLMKVLGFNNVVVAAASTTIRKDLDMIFVIDSSGSMSPVWSTVRSNANSFLNQFSPSTDRVGLVHFSSGAVSDIAIRTGGCTSAGGVDGYFAIDQQDSTLNGNCNSVSNNKAPAQMPAYYNAHNPTDTEFKIVGSTPNTVTSSTSGGNLATNVANASTNVPLAMASSLRDQGVYIFTLGLDGNGGFDADLLKNMANTPDASAYNKAQPSGIYCYAKTINDLRPCFSKLASEILRISQ
jgi:hypothetical protein